MITPIQIAVIAGGAAALENVKAQFQPLRQFVELLPDTPERRSIIDALDKTETSSMAAMESIITQSGSDLQRMHTIRGLFIDKSISIEDYLNAIILVFFDVREDVRSQFTWWLLNWTDLSVKIKAVLDIARALSWTKPEITNLNTPLTDMMEQRNVYAHLGFTTVLNATSEGEAVYRGVGQKVRKPKSDAPTPWQDIDVDEAQKQVNALDDLRKPLMRLLAEAGEVQG